MIAIIKNTRLRKTNVQTSNNGMLLLYCITI